MYLFHNIAIYFKEKEIIYKENDNIIKIKGFYSKGSP